MADAFSGGSAGLLLDQVLKLIIKAWRCKESLKKLKPTLDCVLPLAMTLGARVNDKDPGNDNYIEWLRRLEDHLEEARDVIEKNCVTESKSLEEVVFIYLKRPFVSSKILDINERIKSEIHIANLIVVKIVEETHQFVKPSIKFIPQELPSNIVTFERNLFEELKTMMMEERVVRSESMMFGLRGPGGIGKTFLAKMVHNDEDIKANFGSIFWITVGNDAKLLDLYKEMRWCLNSNAEGSGDLEHQRNHLIELFKRKKVLLILDDVWERVEEGQPMMHWLDVSKGKGSITLVTTRFNGVLTKAKQTIRVQLLTEDESWKLFCYNAFEFGRPPNDVVETIAKDITKKCGGLPLALVVMGGTMNGKKEPSQWSIFLEALKNPSGAFKLVKEKVYFPLELSYNNLDDELKKCFLYFAAFPEDYRISTKMLLTIWHAEQMFEGHEGENSKMKGWLNLVDLADKSLIELSENGEVATIHDVLRNLAISATRAENFAWASESYFHSGRDIETLPPFNSNNVKRMSLIGSTLPHILDIEEVNSLEVLLLSASYKKTNNQESPIDYASKIFSTNTKLSYVDMSRTTLRELPQQIGNLKILKYLNLEECSSLKELPDSIKELTALTSLNLGGCSSLKELPDGIKELKALSSLDLGGCSSLKELPDGIKELKALTSLDLYECSSLKELPDGIKELKALRSLDLRGCSSLKELPDSIKELKALTSLDLYECSSLKELPDGIKELKALRSLDLRGCSSLKELPDGIKELKALTSLDLYRCSSLKELPDGIKELKTLTSLDLYGCSSLKELPDGIKELKALTSLDLYGCSSLKELPDGIKELKALTSLNLGGCSSLKELPDGIKELKALRSLDLYGCSSLKELPDGIKELKALTSLNLGGCSSLKELPDGIKELKALTSLDLGGCSSLKELPDGIKELKALTSFHLYGCSSLKELPDGIKELKALTGFLLEECLSLKELPDGIKELKALTFLSLFGCSFLKELPDGIKELKALTSLNLGGCSSLKELPDGIKELKALTSLNLYGCSSLKELPDGIKELKTLTSLDLYRCSSLKELPDGIKELKALTSLDLGGCSSLKELPDGIKELKALTSFHLYGCSSLKELPDGIKELKALTSLNLGGCSSLKELPDGIKELKALTSLNLYGCSSLKELPDGIKELKALTSFNLYGCSSLNELPNSSECEATQTSSLTSRDGSNILNEDEACEITLRFDDLEGANDPHGNSGDDYEVFKDQLYKDIKKIDCIEEIAIDHADAQTLLHSQGIVILSFYDENEEIFEFYFKNREDMASIVGVGLEYAMVILESGEVTIEELVEEDWNQRWRSIETNSRENMKLFKIVRPTTSHVYEGPIHLDVELSSKKPLLWELTKYFSLRKSIETFVSKDIFVEYAQSVGTSSSTSFKTQGEGSILKGTWKFVTWFVNGGSQENENEGSTSNQIEERVVDDGKNSATIVELRLLKEGLDLKDEKVVEPFLGTISSNLQFQFINDAGDRKDEKEIHITVGHVSFTRGRDKDGKQSPWYHDNFQVIFGLLDEEAQNHGEIKGRSFRPLDMKSGTDSMKTSSTHEHTKGKESIKKGGVSIAPYRVGLSGEYQQKSGLQNSEMTGSERGVEISNNTYTDGGLVLLSSEDQFKIVCDYSIPEDLSHKRPSCHYHDQEVIFKGTWLPTNDAELPSQFVEYRLQATRALIYEGKRNQHKYTKSILVNHFMTHLDGKTYKLRERIRNEGESRSILTQSRSWSLPQWSVDLVKITDPPIEVTNATPEEHIVDQHQPNNMFPQNFSWTNFLMSRGRRFGRRDRSTQSGNSFRETSMPES